ncbi:MAG: hypothetical protein K6A43_09315 [Treponema sp.]|nr:hypothetical protein [Treponema sp.]
MEFLKKLKNFFAVLIFICIVFSAEAQEIHFWESDAVLGARSRDSCSSQCADLFIDVFSDICCAVLELLWLDNHLNMEFDEYPYANESKYIIYDGVLSDSEAEVLDVSSNGKFYRYTLESGAFYFPEHALIGNETRLEGYIYKFFGPVIENTLYFGNGGSNNSNYYSQNDILRGNLRIGGTFNFVNFNIINIAANFQWTYWYGAKNHNGVNTGVIVRSYPFKPVLIEWRGNWQVLDSPHYNSETDPCILESHLELGFMAARYEAYAAWKYIYDGYLNTQDSGIALGLKVHF